MTSTGLRAIAWASVVLAFSAAWVFGEEASLPVAASVASDRSPGGGAEVHGWFSVELSEERGHALLHVPPREALSLGGRPRAGAALGTARPVRRLREGPIGLAAIDREVYAAFAPDPEAAEPRIAVMSMEVAPAPIGDAWWVVGESERLRRRPSIRATSLLGFVGGPRGPVALVEDGDGAPMVLRLSDEGWEDLGVPEGAGSGEAVIRLVEATAEPVLVVAGGAGARAWTYSATDSDEASEAWRPITVPGELGPALESGGIRVVWYRDGSWGWSDGETITVERGGKLARFEMGSDEGEMDGASKAGMLAFPSLGRLMEVRAAAPTEDEGSVMDRLWCREASLTTGRTLYAGEMRGRGLFARHEIGLLAVGMVAVSAVMLGLLLFGGVRPLDPATGLVPASVGQRVAAGAVDLGFGLSLVMAFRDGWVETLELVLVNPVGIGGVVALQVLGAGFAASMLGELALGRSLGKLFAGIVVVSARGRDGKRERPRWVFLLAREAFRWALAPVALVGIFTRDGRHPGDRLAGSIVVVQFPPGAGVERDSDQGR